MSELLKQLDDAADRCASNDDVVTAEVLTTAGAVIRSYRDRLHAANEQALEYQQTISELRAETQRQAAIIASDMS